MSKIMSLVTCMMIPFLTWACANNDSALYVQDSSAPEVEEYPFPDLRIDVYPVADENNVLPQSFSISPSTMDLNALRFDLAETVELSGYVHGTTVYPHSDGVSIPSSRTSIEAQIQLLLPNALNGNIVNTDEDGWFSMFIPANDSYQFSVTPIFPTDLPFQIYDDFLLRDSQDLEVELELGLPIFGHVLGIEDQPEDATVQLIDRDTGILGPKNPISEQGTFLLRAPSDRSNLVLRLEGTPNSAIPTIDIPFINDLEGMEINIDVGERHPVLVNGVVKTSSGVPFPERADIIFQSTELTSSFGELTVETSNDGNGLFSAKLLPGKWNALFIPPFDDATNSAPISVSFEIEEETESITLSDVYLKDDVRIFSRILDSSGQPAPNVLVSFQEVYFRKEIYTGFTDSEGRLDMRVPAGDLHVTLTPTNNVDAITQMNISEQTDGSELQWTLQKGQNISGSIFYKNIPVPYALVELWQQDTLLTTRFLNEAGAFEIKFQVD